MRSRMQELTKMTAQTGDQQSRFPAICVPSFFMKRISDPSPKPTQYYHYHDCYEIYYLYSGERYYFIKDSTYHVEGGSLVFVEPYAIHASANFEGCGYDRVVLYFKKSFVEDLFSALGKTDSFGFHERGSHVIQLDPREQHLAETLFESMLCEYRAGSTASEAYLKLSLAQLLLFVSKSEHQLEASARDYANPTHRMICEITGYINNNYGEEITLSSISKRFHISECYLSRTFKAVTGMSFTEYTNNVRIKEARKYLEKTDMSILHISEAVGFKSNTHFGRVFKDIVGSSPMAYRKNTT